MRFLATIYGDPSEWANRPEEENAREMQAYYAFDAESSAAGVNVDGEALHPAVTAKTIRVRDGERVVTDGPFAETREQLGGYYLLECKDLDEAIEWASKIPGVHSGSVEVREVMIFPPREAPADANASTAATAS